MLRCGDWRLLHLSDQLDSIKRFRRGNFHGSNAFWNVPVDRDMAADIWSAS